MEKWGDSGEKGGCQTHIPAARFDGKEVFYCPPHPMQYVPTPPCPLPPHCGLEIIPTKGFSSWGIVLSSCSQWLKKKEKRVNRDTYLPVASGSQGRKPFSCQ